VDVEDEEPSTKRQKTWKLVNNWCVWCIGCIFHIGCTCLDMSMLNKGSNPTLI
jgi:hypothetical protein